MRNQLWKLSIPNYRHSRSFRLMNVWKTAEFSLFLYIYISNTNGLISVNNNSQSSSWYFSVGNKTASDWSVRARYKGGHSCHDVGRERKERVRISFKSAKGKLSRQVTMAFCQPTTSFDALRQYKSTRTLDRPVASSFLSKSPLEPIYWHIDAAHT